MNLNISSVTATILLSLGLQIADAQEIKLTPEVQTMLVNAHDYAVRGNYKDAITIYKQAILITPGQKKIYNLLGEALYKSGDFNGAISILQPLLEQKQADTLTYHVLATCYTAKGKNREGLSILIRGLEEFPNSGLLFHKMGEIFQSDNIPEKALFAWTTGICKDPAFPGNYENAATAYLQGNKKIWGLVYGEIFIGLNTDTIRCAAMKNLLWEGYTSFFAAIANNTPEFGKQPSPGKAKTFEDAFVSTYTKLTPVVSDGLTAETLTMIRTRFLMEWYSSGYAVEFPFTLFTMQDNMLRNGKFEIYNEWLWGNAESAPSYTIWNTFHEGDIDRFLKWQAGHQSYPTTGQCYNDFNFKGAYKNK